MNESQTGLLFLFGCFGAPFLFGCALGWWLNDRVRLYGPLGALLPKWLREMF